MEEPEQQVQGGLDDTSALSVIVRLPDGAGAIKFEGLSILDLAPTLRSFLAESPLSAPFTSYRLDVELPADIAAAAGIDGKGPRCFVLTDLLDPLDAEKLARIDAFTRLANAGEPLSVSLVAENYDVKRVRLHVRRFKDALVHPPISPATILHPPVDNSTVGAATGGPGVQSDGGAASDTSPAKSADGQASKATSKASELGHDDAGASGSAEQPEGEDHESDEDDEEEEEEEDPEIARYNLLQQVQLSRTVMSQAIESLSSIAIPVPTTLRDVFPVPMPLHVLEEATAGMQGDVGPCYVAPQSDAKDAAGAAAEPSANLLGQMLAAGINPNPTSDRMAANRAAALNTGAGSTGNNNSNLVPTSSSTGLPVCLKSLVYSGWNPPPAPRRMQGDLCYLEVRTLEAGGRTLHITATPTGFYVNKTSEETGFDPSPASPSYFSRTLWTLMQRASPIFRRSYQALLLLAAHNVDDCIARTGGAPFDAALALAIQPPLAWSGMGLTNGNEPGTVASPTSAPVLATEGAGSTPRTAAATYGIAVPAAAGPVFARAPWLVQAPGSEARAPAASSSGSAPSSSSSSSAGGGKHSGSSSSKGGKSGSAPSSAPPSSSSASASSHKYNHVYDATRAEEDLLCTFGMDERGSMRDWNEEWQSCKDLPKATLQDRVVRARATVKVLSDFVEAATQGAMAIVQGHVPALNPADEARSHVYVYNNIFFSQQLDAKAKEKERRAAADRRRRARDAAATAAAASTASPSVSNTVAVKGVEVQVEEVYTESASAASLAADHAAASAGPSPGVAAAMATAPVPASPLDDAAALASPNHDLQGVMALNKAGIQGLNTLATAIITYAGHRIVAQGIIPGILQAETVSNLVYGSVDNGATIAVDADVHSKLKEACKDLFIAERVYKPFGNAAGASTEAADATASGAIHDAPPPNASTSLTAKSVASDQAAPFIGPIECKGIVGSDGRLYLLDMVRTTPRDPNWYDHQVREARSKAAATASTVDGSADSSSSALEYEVYDGAYTALLRPELIRLYSQYREVTHAMNHQASAAAKAAQDEGSDAGASASDAATSSSSSPSPLAAPSTPIEPLALNVNVFTRFMRTADEGVRMADEAAVRDVAQHLNEVVMQTLFNEIRREQYTPADGEHLTRVMHTKGVNVRYMGRLAEMAVLCERQDAPVHVPSSLLELIETEMVARVARRHLDEILRDVPACKASPAHAVAVFLNALLGPAAAGSVATGGSAGVSADAVGQAVADTAAAVAPAAAVGGGKKKKNKGGSSANNKAGSAQPGAGGSASGADGDAAGAGGVFAPTSAVAAAKGNWYPSIDAVAPGDACLAALDEAGFTPSRLWRDIEADVASKFRYTLRLWRNGGNPSAPAAATAAAAQPGSDSGAAAAPVDAASDAETARCKRCHRLILLRRIAQRCGLQLVARSYDFTGSSNASIARGSSSASSILSCGPFTPDDLQGLVPIVKSCMPPRMLPDASETLDRGRQLLAQDNISAAYECINEGMVLLYQVAGSLHREMAMACTSMSVVLWQAGEKVAAIAQQQRAVLLYERLLGPDHPDTAHAHGNLAAYLADQHVGAINAAIRHMQRCIYMLQLAAPPSHPDIVSTYRKLGTIYQEARHVPAALKTYWECLHRCLDDVGHVAGCFRLLAETYARVGVFREALSYEKKAYSLYK